MPSFSSARLALGRAPAGDARLADLVAEVVVGARLCDARHDARLEGRLVHLALDEVLARDHNLPERAHALVRLAP